MHIPCRTRPSFRGVHGAQRRCSELPGGSLREFYLAPPRPRFWRDSLARNHRLGQCTALKGFCSELPGGSLREFYLAPPRSRFWRDSLARKHRLGECGAAPGTAASYLAAPWEFNSKKFVHKRTRDKRTREEDPGQEDKGEENPYEH